MNSLHLIEVLGGVSHSGGTAQTLTERTGSHIDKVQPGSWVALEIAVDLTEIHQFGFREKTGNCPGGVQDRSGMALK